jgi:hypothetical protein
VVLSVLRMFQSPSRRGKSATAPSVSDCPFYSYTAVFRNVQFFLLRFHYNLMTVILKPRRINNLHTTVMMANIGRKQKYP